MDATPEPIIADIGTFLHIVKFAMADKIGLAIDELIFVLWLLLFGRRVAKR